MARVEQAPELTENIKIALFSDPERLSRLYALACDVSGYPNWQYIKYHAPSGINAKEFWQLVVLARNLRKVGALATEGGRPFRISSPNDLLRMLTRVDRQLGFSIETDSPFRGLNRDLQRTYIQRTLTEEAISSSQMEGAATTREVARKMIAEGRAPKDESERMILNNYMTMESLDKWKDESLSEELLFEMQRQLCDGLLPVEKIGRYRTVDEQIYVGRGIDEVLHNPPVATSLPERIARVIAFANEDDDSGRLFLHPLVKAAILHFMIGYEHPFCDGNGRTARAIFYWYLLRKGYWIMKFISISGVLKTPVWNKRYGQAYLDVENCGNDLTFFVLMQLESLCEAAKEFHKYIDKRQSEGRVLYETLRSVLNVRQIDVVAHMHRHPGYIYKAIEHAHWHSISANTARADFEGLVAKGFMQSMRVGKEFQYFAK